MMPTADRPKREAGGTTKLLEILRSKVVLCLTKKVEVWATQMPNGSVVSQIGIMLRMSFSSSTSVTVESLHGLCLVDEFWLSSIIAALSRNLMRVRRPG